MYCFFVFSILYPSPIFYSLYLSCQEILKKDVHLINKSINMLIPFLILDVSSKTTDNMNQLKIIKSTYQKYCYTAKLFTSIFIYLI